MVPVPPTKTVRDADADWRAWRGEGCVSLARPAATKEAHSSYGRVREGDELIISALCYCTWQVNEWIEMRDRGRSRGALGARSSEHGAKGIES